MIRKVITVTENKPSDEELNQLLQQFEGGLYYQSQYFSYCKYDSINNRWEVRINTDDI